MIKQFRHRVGFRGRLILQVQEEQVSYPCGGDVLPDRYLVWRDARVEDISVTKIVSTMDTNMKVMIG